jgi:hypothetical protein
LRLSRVQVGQTPVTDPILLVSLAAVVVSTIVALFAVYYGYRLQLRSARLDRRREAFSEVQSELGGVFETAAILNRMKRHANKFVELGKAEADVTPEELDLVVSGCDACRMLLGIPAPGGQTLRSSRGPNPPKWDEFAMYVYSVRDAIVQRLWERNDRLRRAIAVSFIAGASDSDLAAMSALRLRLGHTASGPPDDVVLSQIEGDMAQLGLRLRQAVEE